MKQLLTIGSLAILLAACDQHQSEPDNKDAITQQVSSYAGDCADFAEDTPFLETIDRDQWGSSGLDFEAMDTRFKAGDNFFCYMNGLWYNNFKMPEDKTRYASFTLLRDKSEARVKTIIEDLAQAQQDATSIEGKVAAYYNAYMDTDAIEAAGMAPLKPYMDRIDSIQSLEDLAVVFATSGFTSPVGGWVDVDSKDTANYIFYITQSGLGLPDRDTYLTDEGKNIETREGYLSYLSLLLSEAGYQDAPTAATTVLALETEIAKAHWDRTVGRNRNLTYNKFSRDELIALGGKFPINSMLATMGIADQENFVVRQVMPDAEKIAQLSLSEDQIAKISGGGIAGILDVMASADLAHWKAYLKAHFISNHSSVLPEVIDNAAFTFYSKQLRGQEEQRPRWKRAVSAVESSLGEAVGKVYAQRHFPSDNKAGMDELVGNLLSAMSDNLDNLDWMGEATKQEARVKLAKFTPKIGYTEKFETYDSMIVGDSAFNNMRVAADWSYQDMISQLGQPIDQTEWFMLPQTVNAYYSPNRNEIVFPAAILQPPFFNIEADPAVNYGAIGSVIGHEIGHGYDDQGSKSDGDGVLRDWWTQADRDAFEAKTDALVTQYNQFCPLDNGEVCINGRLGLGENAGDLGGISMALKAYHMSLDKDGDGKISTSEQAPVINGFTGDQRFFLAYAQVWRTIYREQTLRQQLIRGPHSPPFYRVNGIVRNLDEWYQAFDVGPEHRLYLPPEERIRIW